MAGITFVDRHDDGAVGTGFRRQPQVDDFRELLLHQRDEKLVHRFAHDGRFVRRAAGIGRQIDGLLAHGDRGHLHDRETIDGIVIAGMVAVRALVGHFAGRNRSLDDDLRIGRNIERLGFGLDDAAAAAAKDAGEGKFAHAFGQRHDGRKNGLRVGADGNRDRHVLPCLLPLPVVSRAAAMRKPAHDQPVAAELLHPIDAEIDVVLILETAGDDKRPGDEWRGFARPAPLDRQFAEIDLVADQKLFLAARPAGLAAHAERQGGTQHRQFADRILQRCRRFWFAQISEKFGQIADPARLQPETELDPLAGAEQIGEKRD
ncbi:hypothetical protein D3C71_757810 [compost metagenome]